jgi:hypothetical protein
MLISSPDDFLNSTLSSRRLSHPHNRVGRRDWWTAKHLSKIANDGPPPRPCYPPFDLLHCKGDGRVPWVMPSIGRNVLRNPLLHGHRRSSEVIAAPLAIFLLRRTVNDPGAGFYDDTFAPFNPVEPSTEMRCRVVSGTSSRREGLPQMQKRDFVPMQRNTSQGAPEAIGICP